MRPNPVGTITLSQEAKLDFRQQVKQARENAFRDAESFEDIIHVIERLGCLLYGHVKGLHDYWPHIEHLAKDVALSYDIPTQWRETHVPASKLYGFVKDARNDSMHQGAFARHLTTHAIELALILEDALRRTEDDEKVSDFMVRNPVCAEMWQPISYVRQQMLVNSFSYLPVNKQGEWYLVSDSALVKYLSVRSNGERNRRLATSLDDAVSSPDNANKVVLGSATKLSSETSLSAALDKCCNEPVLIHRKDAENEIIGILTAFDLL